MSPVSTRGLLSSGDLTRFSTTFHLPRDLVLLDPVREGLVARQSHQLGGSRLVAIGLLQGTRQVMARYIGKQRLEVQPLAEGAIKDSRSRADHPRKQCLTGVVSRHGRTVCPDGGAAKGVGELADVPGPGMGLEHVA